MNEKIKLLAEQAKTESSQWLGSKPATTITYDELEKFAELIVRECGKVYIQNQQDGVMTLTQDLLQHFGVEK